MQTPLGVCRTPREAIAHHKVVHEGVEHKEKEAIRL